MESPALIVVGSFAIVWRGSFGELSIKRAFVRVAQSCRRNSPKSIQKEVKERTKAKLNCENTDERNLFDVDVSLQLRNDA